MMAAKKRKPAKAGSSTLTREERIRYDDYMVALSKAEAARRRLEKAGDMFDDDETAEWVEAFANDALSEALEAAKAAYVKATIKKTAPAATEGAR